MRLVSFLPLWLGLIGLVSAQAPQAALPAAQHLRIVNAEWQHHPEAAPAHAVQFAHDAARIRYHLTLVAAHLRAHQPEALPAQAQAQRRALLDTLAAYAAAERFPQNIHHAERRPYFIDHAGTHCAVGYLMQASGHGDLARRISHEQNYAYLADIRTPGVEVWAAAHGFALAELAWIQPAYPPTTLFTSVGHGTNGPIHHMTSYWPNGAQSMRLVFAGDFDSLDRQPCSQIGYYQDGQLTCIGDGLIGEIAQITHHRRQIWAAGRFEGPDGICPLVRYDGNDWHYEAIPGRDSATATTVISRLFNRIVVTTSSPHQPGYQEIWQFDIESDDWVRLATVKGTILDVALNHEDSGFAFAGTIDSVWYNDFGVTTALNVQNIVFADYEWNFYSGEGPVSDTIFAAHTGGYALYFGGTCSSDSGRSEVCLTRYFNGVFQPLLTADDFGNHDAKVIRDVLFFENRLLIGGDFWLGTVGSFGSNLAAFDLIEHQAYPMSSFQQPVRALAQYQNTSFQKELYLGGDMKTGEISHLARLSDPATSLSQPASPAISLSPNPVQSQARVSGTPANAPYALYDLSGRAVAQGQLQGDRVDLTSVPAGVYLLQVDTRQGPARMKVVKR